MNSGVLAAAAMTAAVTIGLALGWTINGWRIGAELAEQRAEHTDLLRATAEANAAIILQQQREQQELADAMAILDHISTERLTHAQTENERLRNLYSTADTERRRLRIEVVVARNDAIVSETTGPGSVGDATAHELSPAAGRTVWDIRRGMIEDQEKLRYLQGRARALSSPPL